MSCWRCQAKNPRGTMSCWACGVRLFSQTRARSDAPELQREAFRHYRTAWTASAQHRVWLDGIVLLSTVLFAALLVQFAVKIVPTTLVADGQATPSFSLANPFGVLTPTFRVYPALHAGGAQTARDVVTQVVEPRRTRQEAGVEAGAGLTYLAVTVVIDNQSRQVLPYDLSDWKVRDSQGHTRNAQSLRGAGWLSSGRIMPGQSVKGMVGFIVPETETTPQVQFSPAALRSVLRWDVPDSGA